MDRTMSAQPVVVISGASQGIGAGLVVGYRRLGYAVVNSRTITASDDPMVLTVPGDIAQRGVGQRIVDAALKRFGRIHMMSSRPCCIWGERELRHGRDLARGRWSNAGH